MAHPQNHLAKTPKLLKIPQRYKISVFFEFLPGNFGGGPFWVISSNFFIFGSRGFGSLSLAP